MSDKPTTGATDPIRPRNTRTALCIVCDGPLTTDTPLGLWDHVHPTVHLPVPDPHTVTWTHRA